VSISLEQTDALRVKHERIKTIRFNGRTVVIRAPSRTEVQEYTAKGRDPAQAHLADEQLLQLLVVNVDGKEGVEANEAFLAMRKRWPLLHSSKIFAEPLGKLLGLFEDEEEKE
jgi:hypothetical protein